VTKEVKFSCAMFLCLALGPISPAGARPFSADLVLLNASVITVDDAQPHAEAFAVKNGTFIAVGTNA